MVRILIERHLREGKKGDLLPLLRGLRTAAMHQPGYITGENPGEHRRRLYHLNAKHMAEPGRLESMGNIRAASQVISAN